MTVEITSNARTPMRSPPACVHPRRRARRPPRPVRQAGWIALLPVNVLSTVPGYLELAGVPAGAERVRAWADRYEAAYPDVFSAYYRGFGSPEGRGGAAEHVDTLAREVG